MCLNLDIFFFRVSSLAYPNLLGKKGYVVVVVYVDKIQSCPIGIPIIDLSKFRIVCYIISFLVYRNSTLGYLVVVFSTPFRGQFSYLVRIILCCKNQKPK